MNKQSSALVVVEQDEGTIVEMQQVDASVLGVAERAAVDAQVATARAFPRSVAAALKEAETLATMDEETAQSMFYVLPRGGKKLEGPSVRLAEIMAYSWGNMRSAAEVVGADATHVIAESTCFDCEKNVAVRVRVKRRITDKNGNRFSEDMITVTGNAASSIALRNAVFKVIPTAFVRRVYHAARNASVGRTMTIEKEREKALTWFKKAGASEAQVFEMLEVKGEEDIGREELITLRGIITAIRDGETSIDAVFSKSRAQSEGATSLNNAVPKQTAKKGAAAEKSRATPAPPADDDEDARLLESFLLRAPEPAEDEPASVYCDALDEYLEGNVDGMSPEAFKVAEAFINDRKATAQGAEFTGDTKALAKAKVILARARPEN